MAEVIIKTNPLQPTEVVIPDVGIVIPELGGSVTITSIEAIFELTESEDLVTLCQDDAYGVDGSTLTLNDGQVDIDPDLVDEFLAGAFIPRSGPYGGVVRDSSGNLPFLTEPDHEVFDSLTHNLAENAFTEVSYDAFRRVTDIVTYTDATKTIKIREKNYVYLGLSRRISLETVIQYDLAGLEVSRIETTYTYDGLRIISSETVKTP